MIGCTDFQEDIDQVAGDVESVKAELTKLQGELTAAQDELEDLAKLDGEVKTLKDAQSKLQTSVSGLEASVKTINDGLAGKADKAAMETAINAANDKITSLTADLAELEKSLAGYATDAELSAAKTTLETVINGVKATAEAAKTAAESAKTAADKAQSTADDATKAANKVATDLAALVTKVDGNVTAISGLTSRITTAESNITALQTETAKIAGIQETLAKTATSDDLKKANQAIEDAKKALDAVKISVDALANQIQSIVFVPEYADGNAKANRYVVGTKRVSKNETLNLTFKVTPAKFAKVLADDFAKKEGKAYDIVLNSVKTKAAEADVKVEIKNITLSNNAGRIEVEAVATDAAQGDDYALSLEVKELTTKANEGAPVTHVVSSYVPVVAENIALTFSIRNTKTLDQYQNQNIEREWSVAEGEDVVNYYDGYDVYAKLGSANEYIKVTELKDKLNLMGDFTYKYSNNGSPVYNPASDNGIKVEQKSSLNNTLANALVAKFKNDTPKAHVDDMVTMKSKVVITCPNNAGTQTITTQDTYTIVKRQVVIELDPRRIDWSYETALKLSSTPANPYAKPIDGVFRDDFKEVTVKSVTPAVLDDNFNLEDVLNGAVGTTKIDGTTVPSGPTGVDINLVAFLEGRKVVSVSVASGRYKFPYASNNADKVYNIVQEWTNTPEETVIKFNFKLTLGAIPYVSPIGSTSNRVLLENIAYIPTTTKYNVNDNVVLKNANFANLKGRFADEDEFLDDFANVTINGGTATLSGKRYYKNGNTTSNTTSTAVFAAVDNATGVAASFVQIPTGQVAAYSDYFTFDSVYKTWYGAEFKVYTEQHLVKPAYSLGFWADLVTVLDADNGSANLKGKKAGSPAKWSIIDENLENYFKIVGENIPATGFTVDYKLVKPELASGQTYADLGYVNFPSALEAGVTATVDNTGLISTVSTSWGDYTARDMKVKATLKYNNIELDEAFITLNIVDPIWWETAELTVNRVAGAPCNINIWDGLKVYGQNSPTTSLVDGTGILFNANTMYDLDIQFINTPEKPVIFKIGGVPQTNVPSSKLDLTNLANGKVVYHASTEIAESVNPVTIMVPVQVKHRFNYNNVGAYTEVQYVTVNVAPVQ